VDSPAESVPLNEEKRNGQDAELTRQFSEEDDIEPPEFVPHYPTIVEEDEQDDENK